MSYAHTSHYTDGPWLLQGARVADPPTGLWARRDVLIVDNEVKTIAPEMKAHEEVQESGGLPQVIDASDLWIWPGLVDLHVHFREPGLVHKETLATGGDAALSGGYSCVVCEPNTDPPLADVNILRKVAGKAWDDTPLRVFFKAAMTSGRNGKEPADIEALARLNTVVGVSDDGDPIVRFDVMEEVFRRSAAVGLPVCPHCEDSKRSREAQQRGVDPGFPVGKYQENEARYIQRDAGVAAKWGVPAHFSHVSLEESLNVIEKIRNENPDASLTVEVTPHHLLLDSNSELEEGSGKVNPPLREEEDRKALCESLIAGDIDAIASDHAPHQPEEKRQGASGFIGMETSLSLMLTHFVHPGQVSPVEMARVMSTQPADILGLPGGRVSAGALADLVIIDPHQKWEVNGSDLKSLSQNTPFDGWELTGRAVGVMVDGKLVFARDCLKERIDEKRE